MIVIGGALAGILWGGYLAKSRNGNRWDIAQYAAVYMIIFTLIGLFVTIAIEYML